MPPKGYLMSWPGIGYQSMRPAAWMGRSRYLQRHIVQGRECDIPPYHMHVAPAMLIKKSYKRLLSFLNHQIKNSQLTLPIKASPDHYLFLLPSSGLWKRLYHTTLHHTADHHTELSWSPLIWNTGRQQRPLLTTLTTLICTNRMTCHPIRV